MERVVYLGSGDKVEADDLAFILNPGRDTALEPSGDLSLEVASRKFQQEFIRRSIKRVQGNMSEAARLLGVHRSNLYRKMRQLGMDEAGGSRVTSPAETHRRLKTARRSLVRLGCGA